MFGQVKTLPETLSFLLVPDFSMMAFTSSIEPLRAANRIAERELYSWKTLTVDGGPVTASNSVTVHPDASIGEAPASSVVFVCAGIGAERFHDKALVRWLRAAARQGSALGGICTGALILARAGLLENSRCTIHWENVEGFAEEFPDLDITGTLFEADRNRFTCAGGTAPLDMMLHAIKEDHGQNLSAGVAELMLHTVIRRPRDAQRLSLQHRTGISHPKLLAVIAHMEAYLENPASLPELSASVGLSCRQLERLFKTQLKTTPRRYYLELRLRRARLLLSQTTMPVFHVAVACGFTSASHFAKSYRALFARSPRSERARSWLAARFAPDDRAPMKVP